MIYIQQDHYGENKNIRTIVMKLEMLPLSTTTVIKIKAARLI